MTKRYNLGIGNLKNMVDLGRIRVPDFQRDYVWVKEDRIRLMDSILKGYPIGVLTLWNPDENIRKNSAFQMLPTLGPIQIPEKVNPFLLLDGLQRLVTIYTCLYPYENSIDFKGYEDNEHRIWLDLEADEKEGVHRFTQHGGKLTQHEIFSFLSGMGNLTKKFQELYGVQGAKKYTHKAQKISRTLSEFQIPVVEFYGDLDEAIEYFVRVNSTGVKMTASDLLKKILKYDFYLLQALNSFEWKTYDYEWVAEAYLMAEKNELPKFGTLLKSDPKITDEIVDDLAEAIEFARDILKIIDSKLWPYRVQFGFIYCYVRHLRRKGNTFEFHDSAHDWLIEWFWKTSYTGFFEDYSRLKEHFEIFVENMDHPQVILDSIQLNTALPFPEKMTEDLKTSREKTLALFMFEYYINPFSHLRLRFELNLEITQFFQEISYQLNPGNIVIFDLNEVLENPELFFVDQDMAELYENNNISVGVAEKFVLERCQKIMLAEREKIKGYLQIPPKDLDYENELLLLLNKIKLKNELEEDSFRNQFKGLENILNKLAINEESYSQVLSYLLSMIHEITAKRISVDFNDCENYFNLLEIKTENITLSYLRLSQFWYLKGRMYMQWARSLNDRNTKLRIQALIAFEKALTFQISTQIYLFLFQLNVELYRITNKVKYLEAIGELCEKLILPIYWGQYHILAENFEEAKKYLNQALLYPEFKNSASNNLIEAFARSDKDSDTDEGILFAEDFLLRTVNPPATTLVNYAFLLMKKKRYDDAINILFDAQSLDLTLYQIYDNLAICYAQLDRQEESLRYLQQAFETAKKFETINNPSIERILEEVRMNPNFEKYRETPYFKAIIQKFERN